MTHDSRILGQILDEVQTGQSVGHRALAVFDLDSTLFDLTKRIQQIVAQFARDPENQQRYGAELALLADFSVHPKDWGIAEALNRRGILQASAQEFWQDVHNHWESQFFSNHHLHHDCPLPGAVEFVTALHIRGAHILYLTGRDTDRMRDGTLASLEQWGFPLGANCELALKPSALMCDAKFKLEVVNSLCSQFDAIWLFENEPVNLHMISQFCPQVRLVFIDSTHSGRQEPLREWPHIRDFLF